VAVIEVGMGGRLDSTNVITPLVSVITNISWDHMDLLGDTLPAIAAEKAGIIKEGVPVVIGEEQEETREVFLQKAKEMNAPILFATEQVHVAKLAQTLDHQRLALSLRGHVEEVVLDLAGDYQERNIGAAWLALDLLRDSFPKLTPKTMREGLAKVKELTGLMGRLHVLRRQPLVISDVAHNQAGVEWLLRQLQAIPHERMIFVWGMVGDKDVTKVLKLLPQDATYYFVKPDIPRGMDAFQLREKAAAFNLNGEVYPSVNLGVQAAIHDARPNDLIFVGGSTFVVAEAI
jgi:dihydrofolate synthase/folylpolyglutamate synthase